MRLTLSVTCARTPRRRALAIASAERSLVSATLPAARSWRWARRGALATCGVAVGAAYASSPGFRRSVTFWSTVAPFFLEYQGIKLRARIEGCDGAVLEQRVTEFHHRTAPCAVDIILSLGGIYVKVGQFVSTMGAGILEDVYIQALRPLQDGVPPRSLAEVSAIIEADIGVPMAELFISFEPRPVGAASIAQAHRATLIDGRKVIVKVQYPEVPALYAADFDNLELVTRLLFPQNLPLIEGLRRRHLAELDFRQEAANLREVRANLQARGFEPSLVRVPAVPDARLCTRHVLAMECLEGCSLAAAIELEMNDVARALGMASAQELRAQLMKRVAAHFETGGGAHRFVDAAEVAAPLVRAYAVAARRLRDIAASAAGYSCAACSALLRLVGLGRLVPIGRGADAAQGAGARVLKARPDITRALRTLVRVHGVAMLLDVRVAPRIAFRIAFLIAPRIAPLPAPDHNDSRAPQGVYNADPHPGNVLLLADGRLGLIDYGMTGRLEPPEREAIARVVLGLAAGDQRAVVDEYERAGYRACWHSGAPHGPDAVFRFATFHLDRIDLSPVRTGPDGATMPVLALFKSTLEKAVPDWVEQARRLGGLLIGVGSQAGRPISLAHEWAPIAEEVLRAAHGTRAPDARRLRTHLTGLT
jgi:aarF domain-containing kinase